METTPRLSDETAKQAAARHAAEKKLAQLRAGSMRVNAKTSLDPIPLDSGRVKFVQPK